MPEIGEIYEHVELLPYRGEISANEMARIALGRAANRDRVRFGKIRHEYRDTERGRASVYFAEVVEVLHNA
jgi:hypothetical protein